MTFQEIMTELELRGIRNDQVQADKSKKYLNITRDTGEFLSLLVKATGARRILEVGTSNGYSTLWLASALGDGGVVYTVEMSGEKAAEARGNFEQAGVASRVVQLTGDAVEVLDDVPEGVDVIFLDADRSTYVALAEKLFGLLRVGGLLVCDNAVSHREELEGFMAWLKTQENLSTSLVPVGKGELLVFKDERE